MSFSNIQFKGTNISVENKWKDIVIQKFSTLQKHIGTPSDLSVQVEFEKMASHNSGDIYRVEANIYSRGKVFRAEASAQSFEAAIDMVHKELDRELAKAHDKHDTLIKRGRRKIKDMLRFGR